MSLFESYERNHLEAAQPLAARMRPRSLEEFVGQQHFLGPDKLLTRLLASDRLGSVIFYGPPGTGKTTLARLIANRTKRHFEPLSATTHGVKEIRGALGDARDRLAADGHGTILFVDEIHRLNRAQQDSMLDDVEHGIVSLIGATTSNPFFAVNSALVSRSQIFQFHPLTAHEVLTILQRALMDRDRGLGALSIDVEPRAMEALAEACEGDARRALNALDIAVRSQASPNKSLTRSNLLESMGEKAFAYDRTGDQHFDTISALIKSIRGSDPDAAIYWLAHMLVAGEDVRFLCRRLIILASEDIGNADPHALVLAVACSQACEQIGLPESQLILSQTAAYHACAPKSNAATIAISEARHDVEQNRVLPVPRHLRDSHYAGAKRLQHGSGYRYAHDYPDGIVAEDYLGVEREYYRPVDRGFEKELADRLEHIREILRQGKAERKGQPE